MVDIIISQCGETVIRAIRWISLEAMLLKAEQTSQSMGTDRYCLWGIAAAAAVKHI